MLNRKIWSKYGLGSKGHYGQSHKEKLLSKTCLEKILTDGIVSSKLLTNLTKYCPSSSESHGHLLDFN